MKVQEVVPQQQRALAKEDLSGYDRQWVALREGRVIASHVSGVALRGRPEVGPGDILMPVPPRGTAVFIL
jgi:hypothetical protein